VFKPPGDSEGPTGPRHPPPVGVVIGALSFSSYLVFFFFFFFFLFPGEFFPPLLSGATFLGLLCAALIGSHRRAWRRRVPRCLAPFLPSCLLKVFFESCRFPLFMATRQQSAGMPRLGVLVGEVSLARFFFP